jgi:hypothetical protein
MCTTFKIFCGNIMYITDSFMWSSILNDAGLYSDGYSVFPAANGLDPPGLQ